MRCEYLVGGPVCYDGGEDGSCSSVLEKADSGIKLGFSSTMALTWRVGGRSEASTA